MAFDNLPPSKPAPRRAKTDPIFCVGWRAFVHWPTHGSQTPAPVPLMNAADQPLANNLVDGQAVEILSWRPRSREGLMYQIRSLADGSEWWIAAHNLRRKPLEEKAGDAAASAGRR